MIKKTNHLPHLTGDYKHRARGYWLQSVDVRLGGFVLVSCKMRAGGY